MKITHGNGTTKYGPGVSIELSGDEVATAISAYLTSHGVSIQGPRTITVNGNLCHKGYVYVDPSGFVVTPKGTTLDGRGTEHKILRLIRTLQAVDHAQKHFGSLVTNRAVTKKDIKEALSEELVKSIGLVPLVDADGFMIHPTRHREGYVLTNGGKSFLKIYEKRFNHRLDP